jgi:hypothetical protein
MLICQRAKKYSAIKRQLIVKRRSECNGFIEYLTLIMVNSSKLLMIQHMIWVNADVRYMDTGMASVPLDSGGKSLKIGK